MRIGIVTPFDSRNFGNRLQNYALQQILLQYADEVITIKNKPWLPSLAQRLRRGSPLAESVWVNRLLGEGRKAKLLEFNREHLNITRNRYWYNCPCPTLKGQDCCDWYCVGSDQIWNPELLREGGFNFLTFAPREKTFSYAASFGIAEIPEEKKGSVAAGLRHIRHLSLREKAGKRIVEELTGRQDAVLLPDPTLLLRREEWETIMKRPSQPLPESYLLTCFLGELSPQRSAEIQRRAAQWGLEVISPMNPASPYYEIGPGEFMFLLSKASFVCTDSFHASVFSFLFQRPLAIFPREGEGSTMESRLDTLVKTYHLEHCRVAENALPPVLCPADYSLGFHQLENEQLRAKAFLDGIFAREERR